MRRLTLVVIVSTAFAASSVPALAQFVQQGPKLVGSGTTGYTEQAYAVALSADGNTAIVGGPQDDDKGAIWFYTRTGSIWTQQGPKLVAADASVGASFGGAVALSADGNTALIGGPFDNNGAVWIFVRSNGAWTQQGPKLVGSSSAGAELGWSVALSADGNTAIVGGPADNGFVGAMWTFARSAGVWSQQGSKVTGPPPAPGSLGPEFARSIALSGDGNTALVGEVYVDEARVFTRSGTTWSPQGAPLTPSDGSPGTSSGLSRFGYDVALSTDGSTAAIGGYDDGTAIGAAWIFTRDGTTWSQQGPKLVGTGSSGPFTYQGNSVSLSSDGSTLVEGGKLDGGGVGATWVFTRSGNAWSQTGSKLVGTGVVGPAAQGESVSLSGDGMTAIVGGWYDTAGVGAAWIFARTTDLRRAGDHDGDGRTEMTVYNTTSGVWSSLTSSTGYVGATNLAWGGTNYSPVPGDYDGDGKTDLGLYVASTGNWYVLLSGSNFTTTLSKSAGGPGWQAVPADYDGDGKTDLVVYNVITGQWWGLASASNYAGTINMSWGGSAYAPVAADYDGDGKADFGVYSQQTGLWAILLSSTNYTLTLSAYCGGDVWTPRPADYDGDGKADLVVYDFTTGQWYGLTSSGHYTTTLNVLWGGVNYQPVQGDYDGDGKADLALYVSNTGMWYILLSGENYTTALVRAWGGSGYTALPRFP
jgi:FG-GAP-like repeat/FG-GAP repeat